MRTSKRAALGQSRLILSVSTLACVMGATDAAAATSEFESFHAAIVSEDKQAALAFIDAFPASPLVDDLIEMLPPEVAQAVCADVPSGVARAQDACRKSAMRLGARDLWGEWILTDDSDLAPASPQPSAEDTSESGAGDTAISPAAGPAAPAPTPTLASARSRPTGTTGERSAKAMTIILPPSLEEAVASEDDKPTTTAARKEAEPAPKPKRDRAPAALRPGGDPGSDLGTPSPPSSRGADPGSDPGSDSDGDAGRDSHN
jgi:hypothetical protein